MTDTWDRLDARERLEKRHVERKVWPTTRGNDPCATEDGYIHYCANLCEPRRWPCDVRVVLDAADATIRELVAAARERDELREAAEAFLSHVAEAASWPTPGIGCDGACSEAVALRAALHREAEVRRG